MFWPVNNEPQTSTSFLLICLAVIDNIMLSLYYLLLGIPHTCIMLSLYYLLLGIPHTCIFYDTCQYYMKVTCTCVYDVLTV